MKKNGLVATVTAIGLAYSSIALAADSGGAGTSGGATSRGATTAGTASSTTAETPVPTPLAPGAAAGSNAQAYASESALLIAGGAILAGALVCVAVCGGGKNGHATSTTGTK